MLSTNGIQEVARSILVSSTNKLKHFLPIAPRFPRSLNPQLKPPSPENGAFQPFPTDLPSDLKNIPRWRVPDAPEQEARIAPSLTLSLRAEPSGPVIFPFPSTVRKNTED